MVRRIENGVLEDQAFFIVFALSSILTFSGAASWTFLPFGPRHCSITIVFSLVSLRILLIPLVLGDSVT